MMNFTLDGRLSSAAKFVRQGARFADIGTDHAYLPIFLLKTGVISYAVSSDINEGPLASARMHAREALVFDKMDFVLTDGADALSEYNVSDIAICGMGGELIADIITRATFFHKDGIRLILQPMSRIAAVRVALAELGFGIVAEEYSAAQGKPYVTVCADFCGVKHTLSEIEAEFGEEKFLLPLTEKKRAYFEKKRNALKRAAEGKAEGGISDSAEARLYSYINGILSNKTEVSVK